MPALRHSAEIFAALGDETRLRIVARLSAGEALSISRLSEGAGVTRQAVTKHLHVLARAGVIRGSREGREQLWALDRRRFAEARHALDRIAQDWDARLLRLKRSIEDQNTP